LNRFGVTQHAIEAATRAAEQAARASYGKLVAILAAQDRDIAAAEDALSEALLAALRTWPEQGVPANPEAWLVTAARNRRRNAARDAGTRRRAEPELLRRLEDTAEPTPFPDHRLRLMFACAHPAIDPAARAPLILQAVLGSDAARIARAFLVPPATMSQRLVRAKSRLRDAGIAFALPGPEDMAPRLEAVLDAVYVTFTTGWDGMDHPSHPEALTGEALFLARLLAELLPQEPEPKGLLALILYCTARHAARRDSQGRFVPLAEQDARLWNRTMIIESEGLLATAAQAARFGRFQCEAAIQSVHIQRPITGRLNLAALRMLYDMLVAHTGSLGAQIGRALVIAEAGEPEAALAALDALPPDRMATHQPWWVARARIAILPARPDLAASALARAIALTEDPAIRAHLEAQEAKNAVPS
jgi:RNA polymerase sigma-70 factor (ECF subfamily)